MTPSLLDRVLYAIEIRRVLSREIVALGQPPARWREGLEALRARFKAAAIAAIPADVEP